MMTTIMILIEEILMGSEVNYLEKGKHILDNLCLAQVAILRAIRRKQQFGDGPFRTYGPADVEFTCYGAEKSVQVHTLHFSCKTDKQPFLGLTTVN